MNSMKNLFRIAADAITSCTSAATKVAMAALVSLPPNALAADYARKVPSPYDPRFEQKIPTPQERIDRAFGFDFGKSVASNAAGALAVGAFTFFNGGKHVTYTRTGYEIGMPIPVTGCKVKTCGATWWYSGGDSANFTETRYDGKRGAAALAAGAISLTGNVGVDYLAYQAGMDPRVIKNGSFSASGTAQFLAVNAAKWGVNFGAMKVGDMIAPGSVTYADHNTYWDITNNPRTVYSSSTFTTHRSNAELARDAMWATFATAGFTIQLSGSKIEGVSANVGPFTLDDLRGWRTDDGFNIGESLIVNGMGGAVNGFLAYANTGKIVTTSKWGYDINMPIPITEPCKIKTCGSSWNYSGGDLQTFTNVSFSDKRVQAALAAAGISVATGMAVDYAAHKAGLDTKIIRDGKFNSKGVAGAAIVAGGKFAGNLLGQMAADRIAPGQRMTTSSYTSWGPEDKPKTVTIASSRTQHRSFGEMAGDAALATFASFSVKIPLEDFRPADGAKLNVGPFSFDLNLK